MNQLEIIIEIANDLHAAIYRYQNSEDDRLVVQDMLADADDLREKILVYRESLELQ
jgi:hypothetical protein